MTAVVNSPNDDSFVTRLSQASRLHQAGQLGEAGKIYSELRAVAPEDPDLNNLSGLLFIQNRQPAKAELFIRKALKAQPGNAQSLFNLGVACKDQQHWPAASHAFAQCVEADPHNIDAINSLANSLRLEGKLQEALPLFERVLELQPGHTATLFNMGLLLNQLGRSADAASSLERVVAAAPANPEAWNDLGVARNKLGKTQEALIAYRQATSLRPDFALAWLNQGLLGEQMGLLHEAADCYKEALEQDESLVDAHFNLAHLRSHTSTNVEIDAMESLHKAGGLAPKQLVRLSFGLGFAHEKAGNFDRAFKFMSAAHEILGREQAFSLTKHQDVVLENIDSVSRDRLDFWSASGSRNAGLLFICGMPRSGTTLTEQILASHPMVRGTGEQTILAKLAGELAASTGSHYPGCLEHCSNETLVAASDRYAHTVLKPDDKSLKVTDTTPMNFMYLALAATLFPHARFVICKRDAMDNCLSIYRQPLTGRHAYSHDLATLGAFYKLHEILVSHWQEVLGDRLHLMEYEALVSDPEVSIRRLLEFCDLPFEPDCLDFHTTERVVRTPSASQVRQPIYSTSIGAWQNYQAFLQPLVEALEAPIGPVNEH